MPSKTFTARLFQPYPLEIFVRFGEGEGELMRGIQRKWRGVITEDGIGFKSS